MISNISTQSSSLSLRPDSSLDEASDAISDLIAGLAVNIYSFIPDEDFFRILATDGRLFSCLEEKIRKVALLSPALVKCKQKALQPRIFLEEDFIRAFSVHDFHAAKQVATNIPSISFETMRKVFVTLEECDVRCFIDCVKVLKRKPGAIKAPYLTSVELGLERKHGATSLMTAIGLKKFDRFYDLIEKSLVDPHEENSSWGGNALFRAVYPERLSMLAYLVEICELDIESKNKSEATPLYEAVDCDNIKSVGYLLGCGANLNIETTLGDTPLKRAIRAKNFVMVQFLLDSGADSYVADKVRRITPLMQSVETKDLAILEVLLKKGCDVNAADIYGCTCISRAILKRDPVLLQYLVDNGAMASPQDMALSAKRKIIIPSPSIQQGIRRQKRALLDACIES